MVTTNNHKGFSVGGKHYRMGAMLTTTLQPAHGRNLVQLIVTVTISQVIKSTTVSPYATAIYANIKATESPE